VVLDARACAFMFADNTVVRNLVWMLEGYRGNTAQVNYYIGRMLERVSKDCELEPMLYQVRIVPHHSAFIQPFDSALWFSALGFDQLRILSQTFGILENTVLVKCYSGRMLEQVSRDCDLEPMLYQVRIISSYSALFSTSGFDHLRVSYSLFGILISTVPVTFCSGRMPERVSRDCELGPMLYWVCIMRLLRPAL
jgi:hypothetical protein